MPKARVFRAENPFGEKIEYRAKTLVTTVEFRGIGGEWEEIGALDLTDTSPAELRAVANAMEASAND